MKIKEVMRIQVITVKRSTSLRKLLALFKDFHTHPLIPVVDEEERLVGMVYPENLLDILRPKQAKLFRNIPFVEINKDVFDLEPVPSMGELILVDDIMDTEFIAVGEEESLEEVYKTMRLHRKERLPVIDNNGKISGIIGIFDIIWRMFKEKNIV